MVGLATGYEQASIHPMLPAPFHHALVLTGSTASGKTALGVRIAQRLNAEIISMDSMALYRHMDIGTAKPCIAERTMIPHHLIDVLEPHESGSVAWWLDQAKRCTHDIEARGKQVLFVGGTPLYLKALLCGLFDGPPADEAIRQRLLAEADALGSAQLHARLAAVDPRSAERIHPNDVRRMVRAFEVYELTGKPMSAWQTQWVRRQEAGDRKQESPIVCLELKREERYERINRRVEQMFAAGWVEEVRRLRALDRPLSQEASKALGYAEIAAFLDGHANLPDTIALVQMRSRNYAKRQMTWFRSLPECKPITKELTESLWQVRMNG
jgi:tRNA dimethylallyltransferase